MQLNRITKTRRFEKVNYASLLYTIHFLLLFNLLKGYKFRYIENPFFELFIKKGMHINL